MTERSPIVIRAGTPGDRNFILSSWMLSAREAGDHAHVPWRIYAAGYGRRIRSHLDCGTTLIACNEAEAEHILGYAVHASSASVLHYVYVKQPLRRMGIARMLLDACAAWRERTTALCQVAGLRERLRIEYDPFFYEGHSP